MSRLKQVLMVAEKPNLASTLANLIGGNAVQKVSMDRANIGRIPLFEWDGPWPATGEIVHYTMTSTFGHVYGIEFEEKHHDWRTNPEELFTCNIQQVECNPKSKVVQGLKDIGKGMDYLVLWLDCDMEGENICFEVINIVVPVMKRSSSEKVYRARFSALTEADVHEAFRNLRKPNVGEALAVDARRELDLRIGVAFTRFLTSFFKRKYGVEALQTDTMPYGPCQTPTLALCVARHKLVEKFLGEKYWRVAAAINLPGRGFVPLKWTKDRTFNQQEAEEIVDRIRAKSMIRASSSKTIEKRKLRPPALNTVQMLKMASSRLRMAPSETMSLAEELYMRGFISYPRTETTQYPPSFDRMSTLGKITGNAEYGGHAERLMYSIPDSMRTGNDAGDHPPIIPLMSPNPRMFQRNPRGYELFQLICSYFLAGLASDCTYLEKTVTFEMDTEKFQLEGIEILEPGFTEILKHQRPTAVPLPDLDRGTPVKLGECKIEEGMTRPPEHLTESDLIDLMEAHGIGTDASIPSHIENIFKRNFVQYNEKRQIVPSPMGIALIDAFNALDKDLAEPQIRSTLERDLVLIAEGKVTKDDIVGHVIHIYKAKFQYLVSHIAVMDQAVSSVLHLVARNNDRSDSRLSNRKPLGRDDQSARNDAHHSRSTDSERNQNGKRERNGRNDSGPPAANKRKRQEEPSHDESYHLRHSATSEVATSRHDLRNHRSHPRAAETGANTIPLGRYVAPEAGIPAVRSEPTGRPRWVTDKSGSRDDPRDIPDTNRNGPSSSHRPPPAPPSHSGRVQVKQEPVEPFIAPGSGFHDLPGVRNDVQPSSSRGVPFTDQTASNDSRLNRNMQPPFGNAPPASSEHPGLERSLLNAPPIRPPPTVYDYRNISFSSQLPQVTPANILRGPPTAPPVRSPLPVRIRTEDRTDEPTFAEAHAVYGDARGVERRPALLETPPVVGPSPKPCTVPVIPAASSLIRPSSFNHASALDNTRALPIPVLISAPPVSVEPHTAAYLQNPAPPSQFCDRSAGWFPSVPPQQTRPVATVAGKVQSILVATTSSVAPPAPQIPKIVPPILSLEPLPRPVIPDPVPAAVSSGALQTFGNSRTSNKNGQSSLSRRVFPDNVGSGQKPAVLAGTHSVDVNPRICDFAHPPGFSIDGKDLVAAAYEFCVKNLIGTPDFRIEGTGTSFKATVKVSGVLYGPCEATSKKFAKKAVAKVFLQSNGFEIL